MLVPLDNIKPPNVRSVTVANDPNVLAIIIFLPVAAIVRNNAEAIWPSSSNRRYCLKNLHH